MVKLVYNFYSSILLLFIAILFMIPLNTGAIQISPDDVDSIDFFYGRWKTESGSLYKYINGKMVCIAVHDKRYQNWVNEVALRNFHQKNKKWYAEQAIRYSSGKLDKWVAAEIEIIDNLSFL